MRKRITLFLLVAFAFCIGMISPKAGKVYLTDVNGVSLKETEFKCEKRGEGDDQVQVCTMKLKITDYAAEVFNISVRYANVTFVDFEDKDADYDYVTEPSKDTYKGADIIPNKTEPASFASLVFNRFYVKLIKKDGLTSNDDVLIKMVFKKDEGKAAEECYVFPDYETPEFKPHQCEILSNGDYYDASGKKVSKEEYEKSCFCRVDESTGKHYNKKGEEVSKEEYEKSCFCRVVDEKNGIYIDSKGNTVGAEEYGKDDKCNPKTGANFPTIAIISLIGAGAAVLVVSHNRKKLFKL